MPFQRRVNQQPAPAVEGDFASTNPLSSIPQTVAGGFKVAAAQSVRVGYFAWAGADGLVYSSAAGAGAGAQVGFVARQANEPSALITAFLGESVLVLSPGLPCTLLNEGDFWATLPGGANNDAVFAVNTTGAPSLIDDATTDPTGFRLTGRVPVNAVTAATSTIALNTGIMTVVTVASGVIESGQRVTGTGVPAETYVLAQLTGTPGGAGTYQTNSRNRAAVAAFAATLIQGSLAKISR